MKTNFDWRSHPTQSFISVTSSAAGTGESNMMAPPAASCVRILLGIDVPAEALRDIKADWAMVAATQQDAPDLTAAAVGTALSRLQRHAVGVAGSPCSNVRIPLRPGCGRPQSATRHSRHPHLFCAGGHDSGAMSIARSIGRVPEKQQTKANE